MKARFLGQCADLEKFPLQLSDIRIEVDDDTGCVRVKVGFPPPFYLFEAPRDYSVEQAIKLVLAFAELASDRVGVTRIGEPSISWPVDRAQFVEYLVTWSGSRPIAGGGG